MMLGFQFCLQSHVFTKSIQYRTLTRLEKGMFVRRSQQVQNLLRSEFESLLGQVSQDCFIFAILPSLCRAKAPRIGGDCWQRRPSRNIAACFPAAEATSITSEEPSWAASPSSAAAALLLFSVSFPSSH